MEKQVTIKEAIQKGQMMVNYPAWGIIIVGTVLSASLFMTDIHKGIPILIFILSFFIFPWLYWSIAIVHWRIWAFSNVKNVHELKRKAIGAKLIWPDESSFNKTEIRTARQNNLLQKLEPKLDPPEISYYTYPSGELPEELKVFNSKRNLIFPYFLYLTFTGLSLFLIFSENSNHEKKGVGVIILSMIAYSIIKRKTIDLKTPQLIINKNGIQTINTNFIIWENIQSINIFPENEKWSAGHLLEIKMKDNNEFGDLIKLDHIEFIHHELEEIIKIYQQRNRSPKNNFDV